MVAFLANLLRDPISAFQGWNYKWAVMPTWHLCGFLECELQLLSLHPSP